MPAVSAFEVLEREVAVKWMSLDAGALYWHAAFRAGVIDKQVERHA
jgi:hypothetical protein